MSDRLARLAARALGRRPALDPVVGPRFGPEPELASEREGVAAPDRSAEARGKEAEPKAPTRRFGA